MGDGRRRGLVVLAVALAGLPALYLSSASATTASAPGWGVSVRVTGAPLFPGVGSQTVDYTITNNSGAPQLLGSAAASIRSDGADVIDARTGGAAVGCTTAWFALADNPPPAADIAPGASAVGGATITMIDAPVNQDACKGVAPTVVVDTR